MSNYDQFAAAVKEISGGKNIVLLDDLGLPSVYVPINKLKNSEIISGGSENTHPAFSVNGVEKSRFLYSKYQNIVINGRAPISFWTNFSPQCGQYVKCIISSNLTCRLQSALPVLPDIPSVPSFPSTGFPPLPFPL